MIMNIYIDKSMCWCEHSIFHVQPPLGLPNMAPGEKKNHLSPLANWPPCPTP